jgi:hypothetical protein
MKNGAYLCLAFSALIGFGTPSLAAGTRAAIESANAKFSALAAQGDGTALAGLYAKEGAVMPTGSELIRGTQAIEKFLAERARLQPPTSSRPSRCMGRAQRPRRWESTRCATKPAKCSTMASTSLSGANRMAVEAAA